VIRVECTCTYRHPEAESNPRTPDPDCPVHRTTGSRAASGETREFETHDGQNRTEIGTHPTPDRAVEIQAMIQTLRDRDCPYLGHYKLGYDAALDDLLTLLESADA